MQQKLYVLAALGVVMNASAMRVRQPSPAINYVNVQVYDDDDDDEPMALNVDINKMEKAMTNSHVDLIVSDFEGPRHHHKGLHHHKDKEAMAQAKAAADNEDSDLEDKHVNMVQQKANGKDFDSEFDTKVLDEYTARTQGGNSNKAEKEETSQQAKMNTQDAQRQHTSQMMNMSDSIKSDLNNANNDQDASPKQIIQAAPEQQPVAPQQQAPVQKAQTEQAPQQQPAQQQQAPAAKPDAQKQEKAPVQTDLEAANKELADAKAELASAAVSKKKENKGDSIESKADKALKKIMKVGEALEKKIDADGSDDEEASTKKAPVAVPIGEKMKQTGLAKKGVQGALQKIKSNSAGAGAVAAKPAKLDENGEEIKMTTSDIVNEIVSDMKVEGLDSSAVTNVNHGIKQQAPQQQQAPVASQPLAAPVAAQPLAAPVAAQPLAAPVAQQRIAAPVAQQRIAAPVAAQPLAAPVATQPVATTVNHIQQQTTQEKRQEAIKDTVKVIQDDGAGEDSIETVSEKLTNSILERADRQSNAQIAQQAEAERERKQKEVNAVQQQKVEEEKREAEEALKKPILSQTRGMIMWPEETPMEHELDDFDTHYSFEMN